MKRPTPCSARCWARPYDEQSLPATARLFARLRETEGCGGRARQEGVQARAPLHEQRRHQGPGSAVDAAAPTSGHTTNATLAAIVMGSIVPERRDAISDAGSRLGTAASSAACTIPMIFSGGKLAGTAIAVTLQGPAWSSRPTSKRRGASFDSIWGSRPSYILPGRSRAERPAMDLRRAVVDAEGTGVAEDALDHGVARHAQAAQDLHRASATRAIASEHTTLAIELSVEARSPLSSSQAVCRIASRA